MHSGTLIKDILTSSKLNSWIYFTFCYMISNIRMIKKISFLLNLIKILKSEPEFK